MRTTANGEFWIELSRKGQRLMRYCGRNLPAATLHCAPKHVAQILKAHV